MRRGWEVWQSVRALATASVAMQGHGVLTFTFAFHHLRNWASSNQQRANFNRSPILYVWQLIIIVSAFAHSFCFLLSPWMTMLGLCLLSPCPFYIYWIKKDKWSEWQSYLITSNDDCSMYKFTLSSAAFGYLSLSSCLSLTFLLSKTQHTFSSGHAQIRFILSYH